MIFEVRISRLAARQLEKVPSYILDKLESWVDAVTLEGLENVRKVPGYHDESLQGMRWGQRSIRLSRSYRAIYIIDSENKIEFVSVEEVTKHDY